MTETEIFFTNILSAHLKSEPPSIKSAENVNMKKLEKLALSHKLLPIVYTEIKKHFKNLFDSETDTALKKKVIFQSALQVSKNEAFLRLCSDMTDKNISFYVVKGIICAELYPEKDMRLSSDNDILVPPVQIKHVKTFFREQGYEEEKKENTEDSVYTFINKKNSLHIEIHTALFPEYPKINAELNKLFEKFTLTDTLYPIKGHLIPSLSYEDHFLFLVLHSFKHFIYCGFGVRQLMDIVLFAKTYGKNINFKSVIKKLKSVSAYGFFIGILSVCNDYFMTSPSELGIPVSNEELLNAEDMMEDMLDGGIYGTSSEDRLHSSKMTLAAADKKKKVSFISSLFPSADAMRSEYPYTEKYKILLPAAWTVRIIRHIKKKRSPCEKAFSTHGIDIGKSRLKLMKKYGIIK